MSKLKYFREFARGELNAGTGVVMLIILLMTTFGAMLVGNLLPVMKSSPDQPVVIISISPQASKGSIQLYTFGGITLTPSPSVYILPQAQESGGSNYGSPPDDGGSSAPRGGGGGGGQGGSAI